MHKGGYWGALFNIKVVSNLLNVPIPQFFKAQAIDTLKNMAAEQNLGDWRYPF